MIGGKIDYEYMRRHVSILQITIENITFHYVNMKISKFFKIHLFYKECDILYMK